MDRQSSMVNPSNFKRHENSRNLFNTANWQATGVINDLPAPAVRDEEMTAPDMPTHPLSGWNSAGTIADSGVQKSPAVRDLNEVEENNSAAQFALREVLESLEAAKYVLGCSCTQTTVANSS